MGASTVARWWAFWIRIVRGEWQRAERVREFGRVQRAISIEVNGVPPGVEEEAVRWIELPLFDCDRCSHTHTHAGICQRRPIKRQTIDVYIRQHCL